MIFDSRLDISYRGPAEGRADVLDRITSAIICRPEIDRIIVTPRGRHTITLAWRIDAPTAQIAWAKGREVVRELSALMSRWDDRVFVLAPLPMLKEASTYVHDQV